MIKKTRPKSGFTLIEIIITIIILSVLATLALTQYNIVMETQRYNKAVMTLKALYMANEVYKTKHGDYYNDPTQTASSLSTELHNISEINAVFETSFKVDDSFKYTYSYHPQILAFDRTVAFHALRKPNKYYINIINADWDASPPTIPISDQLVFHPAAGFDYPNPFCKPWTGTCPK